ncbi:hypothetical protein DPMN_097180 [Dreissena polymorpha]|uniref:Uncharacterized protein n=1 Tax=Dreissena polymorpha TaxID=45954 RepID=A0A9D4LB87_DREPO|nr:hypothetical protein DPMN_097180 [Dreissena polymorpha]
MRSLNRSHELQRKWPVLCSPKDIIRTHVLTNFHIQQPCCSTYRNHVRTHKDWTINVTFRILTRKMPRPWWPCFSSNWNHFELVQNIIGTTLLNKFHNDLTINVASRVLTSNNALPPGGNVFQQTRTVFELTQDIITTYGLTMFHNYWTIDVTFRVKNAQHPGGHVFQPTETIFELVQDIFGTNLFTKFHEDQTINVASRVKNARPLRPYINGKNLLNKFHYDQTINVASRVLTRLYYSHIRKNALPPGSNFFQPTGTIFELVQDIIDKNFLSKFHENQTIKVASRVLTRQMFTPHNRRNVVTKAYNKHILLR